MKELKDLQEHLKVIHALYSEYDDICTLIEMVDEEEDRSMVKEIEKDIAHFEEDFEKLRIETLLSGEYDSCNAIMTLHAGTGGTEACDWVNMLYRMYTRWFQTKGFSVQVLDYLDGDITGIKNITFEVVGDNAYGYLKSEKGASIINSYSYTENESLKVLQFETTTEEWLQFVVNCRRGIEHAFDIVEGPMADDQIWDYVEDYMSGKISKAAFWELIKFKYPTHQIVFCTEDALKTLHFERSETL